MVGAVLAAPSERKNELISPVIFFVTIILSTFFNVLVCLLLYWSLFKAAALDNAIPVNRPLFILLISILGAFVTYNFPKQETNQQSETAPDFHAEGRKKVLGRQKGIGAPGVGLRGPEARKTAPRSAAIVSRLTSLPIPSTAHRG